MAEQKSTTSNLEFLKDKLSAPIAEAITAYIGEVIAEKALESQSGSGVFSNLEILAALESGHIRIHPFIPKNLNTTSYDLTLGEWFYKTDVISNRVDFNPFDEKDVLRYFGEPLRAEPHRTWCKRHQRMPFEGIPLDHPIIVLNPGERILAHTHEFIGISPPGTTQMQARSTWGRLAITACKDAGWGDSGYIGRWTMEVQNDNQERVPLPIGERVAQMIFYHSGPVEGDYGIEGKYYAKGSIEDDVARWQPEMMLPRAYLDERIMPREL